MNNKYLVEFEFLNDLRESATINMMGDPRELQYEFDVDKTEARKIFGLWTETLKWANQNLNVGNVVQNTIMISVQPKMFLYVDGVQAKKKKQVY